MTPQEFLDEFGTLAESAEGVPKLRALILELAVRGKLVEQDEGDGEASDLHTTILSGCRDLELKGAPRKKHESIPVPPADEPFSIPANWKWVSLGDFGVMLGGGTPSKQNPAFWDGDIPWVSPKDMKVSHIADAIDHVTQDGIDQSSAKLIPKNAMLMVVRGMILIHSFPVALSQRELAINQDMKAIVLGDARIGKFLLLAAAGLRDQMLARVERSSHGTCRIDSDSVSSFPIPLPPLAEQYRIVSKVDELMGFCDRLEAVQGERRGVRVRLNRSSLDRLTSVSTARGSGLSAAWQRVCDHFEVLYDTPETLPDLRQTILQLAVQGKLVPQDPNDEPAEGDNREGEAPAEPLAGDDAARQEPRPPNGSNRNERALGEILCENSLNGYGKRPNSEPPGTPLLRISAGTSRDDFFVDETDHKWADVTDSDRAKFKLEPRDLLACRFNGNLHYVGKFSMYLGETDVDPMFPDKLIRFRVDPEIADPRYVCLAMNSRDCRAKIESFCATTAGNIGISATNLKTVTLPIPPLSEQKRIVSKVTHLLSQVTRLESPLTRRESTRTQLLTAAIHAMLNDA